MWCCVIFMYCIFIHRILLYSRCPIIVSDDTHTLLCPFLILWCILVCGRRTYQARTYQARTYVHRPAPSFACVYDLPHNRSFNNHFGSSQLRIYILLSCYWYWFIVSYNSQLCSCVQCSFAPLSVWLPPPAAAFLLSLTCNSGRTTMLGKRIVLSFCSKMLYWKKASMYSNLLTP